MAFNLSLAERLRKTLTVMNISYTEKKMFGGLAFLVNDKMCLNVSGDRLMCRFNPLDHLILESRPGFEKTIMKGKELKGYGYINSAGYTLKKDFDFWVNTCLKFNDAALSYKMK